ncbi:MAG: DUF523 domain-containing protein [Marinobacterium sp.]|nr:DUF523 domain-containing protein [Marinobacterium sp.]
MKKILISACLYGKPVRYDGNNNSIMGHPIIQHWQQQGRLVSVCPEVAGGLPTPRPAAETQSQFPILITTREGEDVTPQFLLGAELTLELAEAHNICCALMKARSPSCGNDQIYDGNFDGTLVPGSGAAAAELIRSGIPVFNETQLDQLQRFVEAQDTQAETTDNETANSTACLAETA